MNRWIKKKLNRHRYSVKRLHPQQDDVIVCSIDTTKFRIDDISLEFDAIKNLFPSHKILFVPTEIQINSESVDDVCKQLEKLLDQLKSS